MLLILAAVSLSAVFSDKGVFSRAENAGAKYNEAKAREVLETVLLADGQYEKNINPEYNQDDFLDELIKSEIPGSDVKGDVAIIGEYAYELDRSVPKIGRYLGNPKDLVFPTVNATVQLASDKKNATITINASENKNGINKIEIWLLGEKIKEYKYDPSKPEVTEPYIATHNGKYIIKAYGDLMASVTVEVTGIMPGIEFEPNGNTTWEKQHSTKIKVTETEEKIKNMKYQWTNSVTEPADNTFTETCKDGETITKNNVTGQYYLWILLETESGATAKRRSEAFNFDNEGPSITTFTTTKYSETGITLSATATDNKSGAVKFEFYVDNVLKGTETCTATTESVTKSITITGLSTGSHNCKVIVYDAKNNSSTQTVAGTTKLYAWEKWSYVCKNKYKEEIGETKHTHSGSGSGGNFTGKTNYKFDASTGKFTLSGTTINSGPTKRYSGGGSSITEFWCSGNGSVGYDRYTRTHKAVLNPNATYTKGTTNYGIVTSTTSSTYPNNGYKNNYYYVKTVSQ